MSCPDESTAVNKVIHSVEGGGGAYSLTKSIQVCAAQQGSDLGAPDQYSWHFWHF